MQNLWDTFWRLGSTSNRIDIVFDLYKQDSVKASERRRRSVNETIRRKIDDYNEPLHKVSEMDKFWSCDENKINFQQIFIQ